jgi:hypothetical protein
MFGVSFYHGSIKKYVQLFGTLFNDVWINRTNTDGDVVQAFKIPLSYSPREKVLARVEDNYNLDKAVAIVLPRMGFEITGISYSSERKLSTINKFVRQDTSNPDIKQFQYNPVPYDIEFQLSIFVKNTEDGTKIIEQILPYFTPEWTTTVKMINDPEIIIDVPLILTSVTQDDVYEGSFEERRALIWTLNFTMKAQLFGPTKKQGVIKLANTNFFDTSGFDTSEDAVGQTNTVLEGASFTPGLTSNNEPTSDANTSVTANTISSDDNYGYIVNIHNWEDDL